MKQEIAENKKNKIILRHDCNGVQENKRLDLVYIFFHTVQTVSFHLLNKLCAFKSLYANITVEDRHQTKHFGNHS